MNKYIWIAQLLENLVREERKGKIAEIINENGKIIISCHVEHMTPKEYEKFKKGVDLQNFYGQINFNYSGRGAHTVKIIASLTEEDWNRNKEIFR